MLRRLLHAIKVKCVMVKTGAAVPEATALHAVNQKVAILSPAGRKASMEGVVDGLRPLYGDRGGQEGVNAAHPSAQWANNRAVKMHDLPRRVHTGIGATRADDAHRLTCDALQRGF